MPESVRLDVWLDVACLFKTRSEAQRACKVGRVSVNGAVAKPHRELRPGDEIVISRPAGRLRGITPGTAKMADCISTTLRGTYERYRSTR